MPRTIKTSNSRIEMNRNLHLGINFKEWWKGYDNLRIQHYSDMIKDSDNSMTVPLPKIFSRKLLPESWITCKTHC
ncbi:hypothetical protein [Epilithonimonas mollis]|nr:hypothetical protein [Epilithonimonas mollis]